MKMMNYLFDYNKNEECCRKKIAGCHGIKCEYWHTPTLIQEPTLNKTHRLERVTRLALKLLMEHTAARVNIWPSSGAIDREPHAQPADGGEVHTQWELPHIHSIFLLLFVLLSHTHTYTQRQCNTLTKTHYNLWASAFTDSKNEEPDTVIHQ